MFHILEVGVSLASGLFKILTATVLLIAAALTVSAADDDSRDWNQASPAEIHSRLAEGKVSMAARADAMRQLIAGEAATLAQTDYDVKFYDVYIRINDTNEIVYGRVKFVAAATVANVSTAQVDLWSNMTVDSIVGTSGPLTYTRSGNVVTVNLGQPYQTGEEFTFDFWYRGHPTEQSGFGAFEFTYVGGYRCISSLSEPYFARTWWPCKDRMDDKADSFNIAIEVDTTFYVGSNGTLDSVIYNGANTETFFYRVRYPMASYLFSVAVGPYMVWEDEYVYNGGADTMPITNAVFPDWYDYSLTAFDVTPEAIAIFSDIFGPYPFPNEKYGHSLFSWGGAMEHQTMSSMNTGTFGMSTPVIVHELSHQWWGDMITCKSWRDIWLNEGWASYAEALYYERLNGQSAYVNYMLGMQYFYGGTIYCQDTSSVGGIFTSRVYDKGAWALHMLRGVLGDSLFFAAVDAYYNSEYQHNALTTEQYKNLIEQTTGVELDWFFTEWIYGSYYPYWNWYWTSEAAPGGGTNIFVRVKQVQTNTLTTFKMPIKFVISGANDTLTAWVDEKNERLTLHTDGPVGGVAFDPMHWVLDSTKQLSWTMFITSQREDLKPAEQYTAYLDTIIAKGGSASRTWSVVGGTFPSGLSISSTGIVGGAPNDTGAFAFTVRVQDNSLGYSDQVDFTLYVAPTTLINGDVNGDLSVNVADLTFFVNYLFKGGAAPVMPNTADVDASCTINVSDLTYMVNFLFKAGLPPVRGCVN